MFICYLKKWKEKQFENKKQKNIIFFQGQVDKLNLKGIHRFSWVFKRLKNQKLNPVFQGVHEEWEPCIQ